MKINSVSLEKYALNLPMVKWIGKYINIKRIFQGLFWVSIGNVFSSIASSASSLVLARTLGADQFGKLALIQGVLAVFIVLSGPSLGYMATKYIAEYRFQNPSRAAAVSKLSIFSASIISAAMGGTLVILAPYIANEIMRTPELTSEIYIGAGILIFTGVNSAQLGALSGLEAFKELALINIIRGVFTLALPVLGGYFYGISGVLSGLLIVSILACMFSRRYMTTLLVRHSIPNISIGDALKEVRLLFSFSLPNWLFSLVNSIANIAIYVMLSRTPHGYMEIGIFNVANQFFLLLNFIPIIIWQVSLPVLSGIAGKRDYGKLKRTYRKLILINIICIALLIVIVFPSAQLVMKHLGKDFAGQTPTLIATLLLTIVYSSANVAWQVMLVLGHIWSSLWLVVFQACVYIFAYVLFEDQGAYTVALARLVSYGVYAALTIFYVERFFKYRIQNPSQPSP